MSTLHAPALTPLATGDADAWFVAAALSGQKCRDRWQHPPSTPEPSPNLALAMARTTATGMLRFLVEQGAERHDDVVGLDADGRTALVPVALSRRAHAPPLALSMWPPWQWSMSTTIMTLAQKRRQNAEAAQAIARSEQQQAKHALSVKKHDVVSVGDHVALAMALSHLPALELPTSLHNVVATQMARRSALAALYHLDNTDLRDDDIDFAALVAPPLLRVFELVAPGWARSLVPQLLVFRRAMVDASDVIATSTAVVRRVRRVLQLLDDAGRLDLAGVLVEFASTLPAALPVDTRAQLVRLPGVTTMADRDRVVAAVAATFEIVDDLQQRGQRTADSRYGDDRWTEARLVRGWLQQLAASRASIDAARHALLGDVT